MDIDDSASLRALLLMAALSLFSGASPATTLTLPPANNLSSATFGDFTVHSLDILEQCAAAGDPRCLPSGPYPVASSPGQIDDQLVIYTGNNGLSNFDQAPFPGLTPASAGVDEPFRAPAGAATSFDMTSANEPGSGGNNNTQPEFSLDVIGRWDAYLPAVLSYLTNPITGVTSDLVFLFDNNQVGSNPHQWQSIWGQIRILDDLGDMRACYELNASSQSGCVDTGPSPTPDIANDYAVALGNFCVDTITGGSYNIGTAGNAGDCTADANHPAGGYFVNNNLGQSRAEFAAYIPELNTNLFDWASQGWSMSIDFRLANLNDGHEQLWICSRCSVNEPSSAIPEPGHLFVIGLVALLIRRQQQHRLRESWRPS